MKLIGILKKIIIVAVVTCLAIGISIYSCILYSALESHPVKSDVMIVLGCKAKGSVPSPMLEYRLKEALDLFNKGYAEHIIVSGGKGANETEYESTVMKNWLTSHGVAENSIIEENKSSDTYENLKFSKALSDKEGYKTYIIVSSDFHIFRSERLAKRLHMKVSGAPAPTVWYLVPSSNAREILSVIKSFALGRL